MDAENLVDRVYEAAVVPEYWPRVLQQIGLLAEGDAASLIAFSPDGSFRYVTTESYEATHVGWTVGAGVEFAVADNVSLNLEYRYSDFGSQTYDHGSMFDPPEFHLTTHAVTAGVNFRF